MEQDPGVLRPLREADTGREPDRGPFHPAVRRWRVLQAEPYAALQELQHAPER